MSIVYYYGRIWMLSALLYKPANRIQGLEANDWKWHFPTHPCSFVNRSKGIGGAEVSKAG